MTQLQRDGRWDQGPLPASIERRKFPAILIWKHSSRATRRPVARTHRCVVRSTRAPRPFEATEPRRAFSGVVICPEFATLIPGKPFRPLYFSLRRRGSCFPAFRVYLGTQAGVASVHIDQE